MSVYRKVWECCGDVTETESWEPEKCPFCCPANNGMEAAAPTLHDLLKQCAEYLECIPESAAGGDDEAVKLAREARAVLAKVEG